MAPSPKIALIVNPAAGRGRVARELPTLLERLKAAGQEYAVLESEYAGHAVSLARASAADGFDIVAAVGGDGTVNEVVNGIFEDGGGAGTAALGVIAAGSGSDFARSFGLPKHTRELAPPLFTESRPLDVARVVCDSPSGRVTRHCVNVAEAGLGAEVVARASRLPRRLGRARYLVAFWPTLVRFSPCRVRVVADGEEVEADAHNVVVANARFFGGGMLISPHSDPADGRLDVQMSVGAKAQAFTLIPKIYRGSHLPDRRIVQLSGKKISIDADRPLPIETDGELVGTTPATIDVIPHALRLAME